MRKKLVVARLPAFMQFALLRRRLAAAEVSKPCPAWRQLPAPAVGGHVALEPAVLIAAHRVATGEAVADLVQCPRGRRSRPLPDLDSEDVINGQNDGRISSTPSGSLTRTTPPCGGGSDPSPCRSRCRSGRGRGRTFRQCLTILIKFACALTRALPAVQGSRSSGSSARAPRSPATASSRNWRSAGSAHSRSRSRPDSADARLAPLKGSRHISHVDRLGAPMHATSTLTVLHQGPVRA
jgi:hypothetical protein